MPNENSNNHSYRVLLVDDNADDVKLFLRVLGKVQTDLEIEIDAQSICNGSEASTQLKERKYDAIFLDVNMAPPNGMDLTKQIRGSDINRTTPIVMITGAEDRGVMTRAFQAGVNLFLFKPVDRMRLMRLIQVARVPIDREKRRLQRVKVKCRVTIESGRDRLDGETLDLSLNGMFVQTNHVLPVGSIVNVSLMLPPAKAPVRTAARVVRIIGNEFMGLQLENTGKAETEKLGEFLVPLIVASC